MAPQKQNARKPLIPPGKEHTPTYCVFYFQQVDDAAPVVDSPLPRPGSTEPEINGAQIRHNNHLTTENLSRCESLGSERAVDHAHAPDTPPGQLSPVRETETAGERASCAENNCLPLYDLPFALPCLPSNDWPGSGYHLPPYQRRFCAVIYFQTRRYVR